MNKNTKKFVVTLLSVLMVLSFMPAMAFADGDEIPLPTTFEEEIDGITHEFNILPDEDLSVAATHDSFGIDVYPCLGEPIQDSEGKWKTLACNAKLLELTDKTDHVPSGNKVRLTKAQYFAAAMEEGLITNLNEAQKFFDDLEDACYAYVDTCKECGAYIFAGETNVETHKFEWNYMAETWKGHVLPDGTKDCQETYECDVCTQEITRTDVAHGPSAKADATTRKEHDWKYDRFDETEWEEVERKHISEDKQSYVSVRRNVCEECGKEKFKSYVVGNAEDIEHTLPTPKYASVAEWEAKVPDYNTRVEELKYMIMYNNALYEPNDFDDEPNSLPTCTDPSSDDYGLLVCEDCGLQLTDWTCMAPAYGHTYLTESTDATCEDDGIDTKYCVVCGHVDSWKKNENKATGHSYKVTVLAEPTIYDDGITVIECEKCGDFTTNRTYDVYGERPWIAGSEGTKPSVINSKKDNSGDYYFVGFDQEWYTSSRDQDSDRTKGAIDTDKAIKLDPFKKLTPKFGAYEKMQDATCTLPEIEAAKDSVSGDYDVHHFQRVGKALGHEMQTTTLTRTCGEYGYTYNSCTRCQMLLDKDGKVTDFPLAMLKLMDAKTLEEANIAYDLVNPVVAVGTPCTFDKWEVKKAATATEEGLKALVCSKCGAESGVTEAIPIDPDEAKEYAIQTEATPALEAAAPIVGNSAKYTADSVKAINDAIEQLNRAIASGTASDVTRMAEALKAATAKAELKAANTMTVKAKTVKASSKKKMTFKKAKAFTVKKAKGKVTFIKKSGNKKITVSKAGKVTVKKGLKKGKTYKVKVQVTAAGNGNYLAKTKTVTLKVKITK